MVEQLQYIMVPISIRIHLSYLHVRTCGFHIEIHSQDTAHSQVLQLHSSNPEEYRAEQLRKLLPFIINPNRVFFIDSTRLLVYLWLYNYTKELRNFYGQPNRPHWYPAEVPFKSPNHASGMLVNDYCSLISACELSLILLQVGKRSCLQLRWGQFLVPISKSARRGTQCLRKCVMYNCYTCM